MILKTFQRNNELTMQLVNVPVFVQISKLHTALDGHLMTVKPGTGNVEQNNMTIIKYHDILVPPVQ